MPAKCKNLLSFLPEIREQREFLSTVFSNNYEHSPSGWLDERYFDRRLSRLLSMLPFWLVSENRGFSS